MNQATHDKTNDKTALTEVLPNEPDELPQEVASSQDAHSAAPSVESVASEDQLDQVDTASMDSFPCSDPPGYGTA